MSAKIQEYSKELVVLAADGTIKLAFQSLAERTHAIPCRPFPFDVPVHTRRDPGCANSPETILAPYLTTHARALVLFDLEGSGLEEMGKQAVEEKITKLLARNGWEDRCRAVAFVPELEEVLWSSSAQFLQIVGWKDSHEEMRSWLESRGFRFHSSGKPERPKEAIIALLEKNKIARSKSIHGNIAQKVSFQTCASLALQELLLQLREWFPL